MLALGVAVGWEADGAAGVAEEGSVNGSASVEGAYYGDVLVDGGCAVAGGGAEAMGGGSDRDGGGGDSVHEGAHAVESGEVANGEPAMHAHLARPPATAHQWQAYCRPAAATAGADPSRSPDVLRRRKALSRVFQTGCRPLGRGRSRTWAAAQSLSHPRQHLPLH